MGNASLTHPKLATRSGLIAFLALLSVCTLCQNADAEPATAASQQTISQKKSTNSPQVAPPPQLKTKVNQGNNGQNGNQAATKRTLDKSSITNTVQAISAAFSTLASVALAIFAAVQIVIYRNQTKVMTLTLKASARSVRSSQRSAKAAEDAVSAMREIDKRQGQDVKASIFQAGRAADAMSDVASRLEENAYDQRNFWKKQMRAYLSVGYGDIAFQNPEKGYRYEIRLILANTGHTPAHEVIYSARADMLSYPVEDDFDLTVRHTDKASVSVIAPGQNRIMTCLLPRLYSDDEITSFTEGKTRLYMWGMAT